MIRSHPTVQSDHEYGEDVKEQDPNAQMKTMHLSEFGPDLPPKNKFHHAWHVFGGVPRLAGGNP